MSREAAERVLAEHTALVDAVEALAEEWEAEAADDERWLNGPHVAVSEAHEYPATIRQARSHAARLRALVGQQRGRDGGGDS